MARYDNRHSRVVAWLKVTLPLASLALLSSMFLLSRDGLQAPQIPFSDIDISDMARAERIGAPNYAGVTNDGAAVSVLAEAARPIMGSGGARISASGITAELVRQPDDSTRLVAGTGLIDTDAQTLNLTGGVEIVTATGLVMNTASLRARLDRTLVESGGAVTGRQGPHALDAGRLRLSEGPAGLRLLFTGGVKLVYTPSG